MPSVEKALIAAFLVGRKRGTEMRKGRGGHTVLTVGRSRVVLAGHRKELFAVGEPVTVPRHGCSRNASGNHVATAVHKKKSQPFVGRGNTVAGR